MPGIHAYIGEVAESQLASASADLIHEPHFKLDVFVESRTTWVSLCHYDGYPFSRWSLGPFVIIVEGMIYNYSNSEVRSRIDAIAERYLIGEGFDDLVRAFVESADGEFLVAIVSPDENRLIVFNDYAGRIPLYYYADRSTFMLGRQLRFLVTLAPNGLYLNKLSIVENLLFDYALGNKTLFHDLLRLEPSQGLEVTYDGGQVRARVFSSARFVFCLDRPYSSKSDSLDALRDIFVASVASRVNRLGTEGLSLISDLSGGFDTRAVLGGLSACSHDVSYYTVNGINGDESAIAQRVFEDCGSPGRLSLVDPGPSAALDEAPALVYKTDGLVDYWTTAACYREAEAVKGRVRGASGRFVGYGGEFIRHPYTQLYRSLEETVRLGLYSQAPLDAVCRIAKTRSSDYVEALHSYLGTWPERKSPDRLRRFYYEYYCHYVGAGEDRERIHFWSVAPLWSLEFIKAVFAHVPLQWTGFAYFAEFMRRIDPRLLRSPVFGRDIDLKSPDSVFRYDRVFRGRLAENRRKSILISALPPLYSLYRSFRRLGRQPEPRHVAASSEETDYLVRTYSSLDLIVDSFDLDAAAKAGGPLLRRLATLGMYVSELQGHCPGKVVGMR
jgi:hypothetical protein